MIRQRILVKEQELGHCLKATKVELPTKWFNYDVPNCPTKLANMLGEPVNISEVIQGDVVA
ncbi:hypothetical protein FALCPG4_005502 [Fusarium falciforme]